VNILQLIPTEPFSDREQSNQCWRTTCVVWCRQHHS